MTGNPTQPATAQDVIKAVYNPLPSLLRSLSKDVRWLGLVADPERLQDALRNAHEVSVTLRRLDTVLRRESMYD
ncbi:hypothetical protein GCM10027431_09600 [Lysobacter rhizosphaerae]